MFPSTLVTKLIQIDGHCFFWRKISEQDCAHLVAAFFAVNDSHDFVCISRCYNICFFIWDVLEDVAFWNVFNFEKIIRNSIFCSYFGLYFAYRRGSALSRMCPKKRIIQAFYGFGTCPMVTMKTFRTIDDRRKVSTST